MRKILSLFICMLALSSMQAQVNDTTKKEVVVFEPVQIPASFPGGTKGWIEYLSSNLKSELGGKYIVIPKGQKKASQKVILSFIVGKEGYVTEANVENLNEVHPKLAEEAKRVILDSPQWQPAKQNGRYVIYRHRQTITFTNEK